MRYIFAGVAALITFIFTITIIFGSWYTVDQTQRGVILRNGAIVGLAQPGLGFKTPWIESVEKFYVTTKTVTYTGMESYSSDQQPAHLKISVTYHPDVAKIADLYARFATEENAVSRTISPHVAQQVKVVFGQYTAVKAIQDRAKLNADIRSAIAGALVNEQMLILESVQVEDIQFSPAYMASIEQRMLAEVEVQKLRQNAEREKVQAQIAVTQAQALADATTARNIADAENTKRTAAAQAYTIQIQGEASAKSIQVQGEAVAASYRAKIDALKGNAEMVSLVASERWNGALPTTMVPGSAVPFLTVK